MRKRSVNLIYDKLVWGVLFLLPILLYSFYLLRELNTESTLLSIEDFLTQAGLFFTDRTLSEVVSSSPVASMFFNIFENGFNGIMYVTGSKFLSWYLMYMIFIELLHLCVDVILLLPRITRKFFDKFRSE